MSMQGEKHFLSFYYFNKSTEKYYFFYHFLFFFCIILYLTQTQTVRQHHHAIYCFSIFSGCSFDVRKKYRWATNTSSRCAPEFHEGISIIKTRRLTLCIEVIPTLIQSGSLFTFGFLTPCLYRNCLPF
jgi:hypothetical protein